MNCGMVFAEKGCMTQFKLLIKEVRGMFPTAFIHIDLPGKPGGFHWLDIRKGEKTVTLEWRPATGKRRRKGQHGFGFYAKNSAYSQGPKKICTTVEEAAEHIRKALE